jgi:hypothetical protein
MCSPGYRWPDKKQKTKNKQTKIKQQKEAGKKSVIKLTKTNCNNTVFIRPATLGVNTKKNNFRQCNNSILFKKICFKQEN